MKTPDSRMKTHETVQDAANSFNDAVNADMNGCWLGLFISIDDTGVMKLSRTTFNFPSVKFLEAISLIAKDLAKTEPVENVEKFPMDDFARLQQHLRDKANRELNEHSEQLQLEQRTTIPLRDDDPVHISMDNVVNESLSPLDNEATGGLQDIAERVESNWQESQTQVDQWEES